jgi:L-ascorbate metabolism protein UlaG (beta-lactamase superfamily)
MNERALASLVGGRRRDVVIPIHFDTFEANLGDPGALVDVVVRERLDVAVLLPSRRRPVVYSRGGA